MVQLENKNNTLQCVQLVHSGDDYFSRLERIIKEAATEIHIQIYIFENDATGQRILSALFEALRRNVKIYILLDGFGSFSLPNKVVSELRKEGCSIRFFSPLLTASPFYIGRRLHKKVIVADGKVALIGGINIANRYEGSTNEKPWLDFAVEINSSIVKEIQTNCKANYFKKKSALRKKIPAIIDPKEGATIRILQNDWLNRKNEISKAYIKAINNAKENIIIVGSYFLPGKRITDALLKAAKRKVTIQLLLSGVSDVPLTRKATCYLYSKLLRHNIELYEWNESILHGKAMVIDGSWSTIGSFNLNNLSSFASVELNVGIESTDFAQLFESELQATLLQCQQITLESFTSKNTIGAKINNALSYYITRSLEIIMTYLPYKRFKHS
jgi:cardiolipin synthase